MLRVYGNDCLGFMCLQENFSLPNFLSDVLNIGLGPDPNKLAHKRRSKKTNKILSDQKILG